MLTAFSYTMKHYCGANCLFSSVTTVNHPLLRRSVSLETEVFEDAEGVVLSVRGEDEEEGVFACHLGQFGNGSSQLCGGLRHISLQGNRAHECAALRCPRAVCPYLYGAVDTFGYQAQGQL